MSRNGPILILKFDGTQLVATTVTGAKAAATPIHATLPLDPLGGDPQLATAALREALAPLGTRWKQALVGLSLQSLRVATTTLPTMPADAVDGFLQLEAERDFLLGPDELAWAWARHGVTAITVAAAESQLARLEAVLAPLGVRELTVMPGALMAPAGPGLVGRLQVGPHGIDMVVTEDGRPAGLRRLLSHETSAANQPPDSSALGRALRLSLSSLPTDVASRLTSWQVRGETHRVAPVISALRGGMPGVTVVDASTHEGPYVAGADCVAAGAAWLDGQDLPLVLERPRPDTGAGHVLARHRTWIIAGAALLLVALLGGLAIVRQSGRLTQLTSTAYDLDRQATELRTIVDAAKREAPWMRDDATSLDLWLVVTEAFPQRGDVWATRLEIVDRQQLKISGKARTREAWLATVARLRDTPGVRDLRVTQTQESADGKSPLTFVMTLAYEVPRGPRTGAVRPAAPTATPDAPDPLLDATDRADATDSQGGRL